MVNTVNAIRWEDALRRLDPAEIENTTLRRIVQVAQGGNLPLARQALLRWLEQQLQPCCRPHVRTPLGEPRTPEHAFAHGWAVDGCALDGASLVYNEGLAPVECELWDLLGALADCGPMGAPLATATPEELALVLGVVKGPDHLA